MKLAFIKPWRLLIAFVLTVASLANALEVDDPKHGFRLTVPDDFLREPSPPDKAVLYQFRRDKEPGQGASVIAVKALDGTFPIRKRVKPSEIPTEEGVEVSFDQIEWQAYTMDVVISKVETPGKTKSVFYTIHFPLSNQAVQLRVGGPIGKEAEIRSLFDGTVASFINTRPLNGEDGSPRDDLGKSQSYKFGELVAKVGIWTLITFVVVRLIARLAGGKKKRPPTTGRRR